MLIQKMAISSSYSYKERSVFDIKTLIEALRFIIVNAILALILLFLTLEEIDWAIFSSREKIIFSLISSLSDCDGSTPVGCESLLFAA